MKAGQLPIRCKIRLVMRRVAEYSNQSREVVEELKPVLQAK
jgi:hypothetical protein